MAVLKNKHVGSTLDSFLDEEGILEHTEAVAIKRTIVRELQSLLKKEDVTQAELARRMGTSKSAINRLLDPNNPSLTIVTLFKAVQALGKTVSLTIN